MKLVILDREKRHGIYGSGKKPPAGGQTQKHMVTAVPKTNDVRTINGNEHTVPAAEHLPPFKQMSHGSGPMVSGLPLPLGMHAWPVGVVWTSDQNACLPLPMHW
jgi:hypothetical protein